MIIGTLELSNVNKCTILSCSTVIDYFIYKNTYLFNYMCAIYKN